MKKKLALKGICIFLLFLATAALCFPWFELDDTSYTLPEFYHAVLQGQQLEKMAEKTSSAYALPIFFLLPVIAGIMAGVKAVQMLRGKNFRFLGNIVRGAEFIYIGTMFSFGGYMPCPAALIAACSIFIEFMVEKYTQEYEEFTRKWETENAREKKEKEDQKNRLLFPGRYDPELFCLLWREMRHQKKSLWMVWGGNTMLYAAFLVLLGMKFQLQKFYGATDMLPSQGLNGIVSQTLTIVVLLYLFFESMAMYSCFRQEEEMRQALWLLGARERLQRQIQGIKYGILILASLAGGLAAGTLLYSIVVRMLQRSSSYPLSFPAPVYGYLASVGFFLLISTGMTFVVSSSLQASFAVRQKIHPNKRLVAVLGATALVWIIISFYRYGQRTNAENIYILLTGIALAAIFLLSALAWRRYLKRQTQIQGFFEIMDQIPFRMGLSGSLGIRSVIFFFHFIFLSVFSVSVAGILSAPRPESMFPYDYVCMARKDDQELFRQLEEDGLARVIEVPMTRVTTVQGDATSWIDVANNYYMTVIWPQGQHIGISEDTYRKLCKEVGITPKDLKLNGEEIHIVYQQDLSEKAHPLDWYMDRENPHLRIGQPLRYYDFYFRDQEYPPRKVKSEERKILTGVFQGGMQENLVVFSNRYFASLRQEEGPSELMLLCAEKGAEDEIEQRLESFASRHQEDSSWSRLIQPYYSKREKASDICSERALKGIAVFLETDLLLMSIGLVQAVWQEAGKPERRKRYRLLELLGARKEQINMLRRREIEKGLLMPLWQAFIFSVPVAGIVIYLRWMQLAEISRFCFWLLLIWGMYLGVQVAAGMLWKRRDNAWRSS